MLLSLQVVEEQYPVRQGYKVIEHKDFKFKESETEPYTNLKITVPENERYTIRMDPITGEVCYSIDIILS